MHWPGGFTVAPLADTDLDLALGQLLRTDSSP